MELWIRSQDKMNLVKVRQIGVNYQDNKQIIANYTPELYENSGGYYELLGTYKTKERSLEVLDEIQNILMPKYILDSSSIKSCGNSWVENDFIMQKYDANVTIQEISTYVYEMPKE